MYSDDYVEELEDAENWTALMYEYEPIDPYGEVSFDE